MFNMFWGRPPNNITTERKLFRHGYAPLDLAGLILIQEHAKSGSKDYNRSSLEETVTDQTQTISCPACGGASQPETGTTHMACTYCGTNLTIPEHLRTKAMPKVEKTPSKVKPISVPEIDAPDLMRKVQPVAVKAFNFYAYWTWIRWLLPTCLTILVVGFILCAVLGALPFVFGFLK
jgi:hypothetical protein